MSDSDKNTNEPNAEFYYDELMALTRSGGKLTPEQFASTCHIFRAAGYRSGLADAERGQA